MTHEFATNVVSLAEFSEEEKAVAMAKCSRSFKTFLEDAQFVRVQGNASDFNKVVVVEYGHNSVADMAIGSLCFEDISILAAEQFFDLQTGGFQGKSSRYVPFSRERIVQPFEALLATAVPGDKVHIPEEADAIYKDIMGELFDGYADLHEPVMEWVLAQPNMAGEKPPIIRARVFDSLRYLLPLGTLTNFGTRLSSRDTAELIRRFLTDGLLELGDAAEKMREAAQAETPTLVRYAEARQTYKDVTRLFDALPADAFLGIPVSYEPRVAMSAINGSTEDVLSVIALEERGQVLAVEYVNAALKAVHAYMATRRTRHDPVPHGFRAMRFTFAITADFGTWKDLRRHRRNENFRAPFTSLAGYTIPEDILAIGGPVRERFEQLLRRSAEAFKRIRELGFAKEARYVTTHGHTQNWVMDMDLEQLIYIAELRTSPEGHISYRRIARAFYDLAESEVPELLQHVLVHPVNGVEAHH